MTARTRTTTLRWVLAAALGLTLVTPALPATAAAGAEPGAAVRELDLGDGRTLAASGPGGGTTVVLDSGQRSTDAFVVLGVSWAAGPSDVQVAYRTLVDGTWGEWSTTGEPADGEGSGARVNTDALVVPRSTGVEVRATTDGDPLRDVKVVLVDPGPDPAGWGGGPAATAPDTLGAATVARPPIISRAEWGADESWRTCQPDHTTELASAAVHHTVSSNTYAPSEAAGIVRGIYAYHVRPEAQGGRGWCDIGYNALVDRFGRVYEGRAHSFEEDVVGVHTGGFNSRTFGVSVIGDFSTVVPPDAVIEGVSQAIAWKFAMTRIAAGAYVTMVSGGGESKYPAGTAVTFPTIYGHRDAQSTACPGQQLYDRLGLIRQRVAEIANAAVDASPVAFLDRISASVSDVTVSGWAFDPDAPDALAVDVVVDGQASRVVADGSRPDVAAAFGVGPRHGFSATVPASSGRHTVCVWVRNVGAGNDHLLGCRDLTIRNQDPVGFLDLLQSTAFTIRATGWAADRDTTGPVAVHVYVDGAFAGSGTADGSRPDLASLGLGTQHGYSLEVAAAPGLHTVCVYAINVPTGVNRAVGCGQTRVVSTPPQGFLDAVTASPSGVRVSGWAFDRDASGPVGIRVLVNGAPAATGTTGLSRPDVAAGVPGAGPSAGFQVDVPTGAGRLRVCVQALDVPAVADATLGCRDVTVVNAEPVGSVDLVAPTPTGASVAGWTIDPDTASPIDVHVYVDGAFATAARAQAVRPDVGAAFRAAGAAHGFALAVPLSAGPHRVCVYAINTPAGNNPLLGCRDVTRA